MNLDQSARDNDAANARISLLADQVVTRACQVLSVIFTLCGLWATLFAWEAGPGVHAFGFFAVLAISCFVFAVVCLACSRILRKKRPAHPPPPAT